MPLRSVGSLGPSVGRRPTTRHIDATTEADWANDDELPVQLAAAVASMFGKMFQQIQDSTAENEEDASVEIIDERGE